MAVIAVISFFLSSCFSVKMPERVFVNPPPLEVGLADSKAQAAGIQASFPEDQATSVPLSRDGAILTAIARNRSLAVERFNPLIAATRAPEELARFDPTLLSTISMGRSKYPLNDAKDKSVSRDFSSDFILEQYLPSGTEVFLSGGMSKSRSDGDWVHAGSWSVGVNQSLLEGAGTEVNLVSVYQAQNSAAISSWELQGFIQNLILQVELAYWDLVLAKEKMDIRRFSVRLAEEQLQMNQDMITAGKLSGDALVTAEAELASREADMVDALADVRAKTINLIRLLDPEYEAQWKIDFIMMDPPVFETVEAAPEISARLADIYRPELYQAKLERDNRELEILQTRNGLLPRLDLFASYGRLSAGDSFGDSWRYLDNSDFDNYELGLTLETVLGNRAEKARHRRALMEEARAEAAIRNLDQLIEAEVRQAAIEVERQSQRIPATAKVVESREEQLRVEKMRFRVGLSTNLDVLRIERDLIQARLDALAARVGYIQALSALYYSEGTIAMRRGVTTSNEK